VSRMLLICHRLNTTHLFPQTSVWCDWSSIRLKTSTHGCVTDVVCRCTLGSPVSPTVRDAHATWCVVPHCSHVSSSDGPQISQQLVSPMTVSCDLIYFSLPPVRHIQKSYSSGCLVHMFFIQVTEGRRKHLQLVIVPVTPRGSNPPVNLKPHLIHRIQIANISVLRWTLLAEAARLPLRFV